MFQMRRKATAAMLLFAGMGLAIFGAQLAAQAPKAPASVDHATLANADAPANVGDWQSYSRTWDEQRYSPLNQINDSNVQRLGLAWYDDLAHLSRRAGQPAGHRRRALQREHLQHRHRL